MKLLIGNTSKRLFGIQIKICHYTFQYAFGKVGIAKTINGWYKMQVGLKSGNIYLSLKP